MDTTKLRRAASWLTFTGVNAALLEVADLLDRLPEPGTCPRCEANAALHRRCPEHQPAEEPATDEEASLCIFCGKDTWDGSRMICTDPECELFQPEEDTAGKDHPHCHKHGEPQPCNVCRARDAEREVQRLTSEAKEWKHAAENINVEVAGYVGQRDAALAEVERLTVVIQDILYKKDWLEEQLDTIRDAREKARVMDDKPWVALEHLEQAIDRLGEGESKGEGGGATAAQEPGAAGPAETGACAAEAPSPRPITKPMLGVDEILAMRPQPSWRQEIGELLSPTRPHGNALQIVAILDVHLAEDAAREARHAKVREAANDLAERAERARGILQSKARSQGITNIPRHANWGMLYTNDLRAALAKDSDG